MILIAALAVAVIVAIFVFSMSAPSSPGAPNVRFTEFSPDRTDIRVGESSNIIFNVQNEAVWRHERFGIGEWLGKA